MFGQPEDADDDDIVALREADDRPCADQCRRSIDDPAVEPEMAAFA